MVQCTADVASKRMQKDRTLIYRVMLARSYSFFWGLLYCQSMLLCCSYIWLLFSCLFRCLLQGRQKLDFLSFGAGVLILLGIDLGSLQKLEWCLHAGDVMYRNVSKFGPQKCQKTVLWDSCQRRATGAVLDLAMFELGISYHCRKSWPFTVVIREFKIQLIVDYQTILKFTGKSWPTQGPGAPGA